ncbi:hypothetical protein AB0C27_40355 [Nonomuraea sp. NPDC048882]
MTSEEIEATLDAVQQMARPDRPTVATSSCTDPNCAGCKAGAR